MKTFSEQINTEMSELERLKFMQKKQKREARLEKEKEEKIRRFISGDLVNECLPRVSEIPVYSGGVTAAKNVKAFEPLRNLLAAVATNEELMAQFNADMNRMLSEAERF